MEGEENGCTECETPLVLYPNHQDFTVGECLSNQLYFWTFKDYATTTFKLNEVWAERLQNKGDSRELTAIVCKYN